MPLILLAKGNTIMAIGSYFVDLFTTNFFGSFALKKGQYLSENVTIPRNDPLVRFGIPFGISDS
jgi:hypothetical protein